MFKHPQDPRYQVTRFRWRYLRQPPGARIHGTAGRGASGARHDESTSWTSIESSIGTSTILQPRISLLFSPEVDDKQKNVIEIVRTFAIRRAVPFRDKYMFHIRDFSITISIIL